MSGPPSSTTPGVRRRRRVVATSSLRRDHRRQAERSTATGRTAEIIAERAAKDAPASSPVTKGVKEAVHSLSQARPQRVEHGYPRGRPCVADLTPFQR